MDLSRISCSELSGRVIQHVAFLPVAIRLEIELTSTQSDGTWTWRAAGAKKPKGALDGALVPDGVAVGDVVKVEAEADLDGLTVIEVFPPKAGRKQPEMLELIGSGSDGPLVTTQLAPKGRGRSRRGDDRGDRGDRGRGRGRGREGGRDGGKRGESRGDGQRNRGKRDSGRGSGKSERPPRESTPKAPARPKAPRLRPKRAHQSTAVKALPEIQRGLAQEVIKGGVPGVRAAVDRMNDKAAAEGMPKIKTDPLVALAEKLLPSLKAAEWHDRAEAALAGIDTVDLRDIRSVVVAAENAARDDETRKLADDLRTGLTARVDSEHRKWLEELAKTIADGRTVRALRLSSRPPKAGAPLPSDMAERLATLASGSLTAEISHDRWATVLDAVAYSPVRSSVKPEGRPESPNAELLGAVKKLASRVPEIASEFGIAAPEARKRGRSRKPAPPPPPPVAQPDEASAPAEPAAEEAAPVVEEAAPVVEEAAPATEEPAPADSEPEEIASE